MPSYIFTPYKISRNAMYQSMGGREVNTPDLVEYCGWETTDNRNADLNLISSDDKVFRVQSSILAQYS